MRENSEYALHIHAHYMYYPLVKKYSMSRICTCTHLRSVFFSRYFSIFFLVAVVQYEHQYQSLLDALFCELYTNHSHSHSDSQA